MRSLLILLLLCYLLECVVTRPAQSGNQEDESGVQEADYERSDEAAPEDAQHEDEDAPVDEQGPRGSDQEVDGSQIGFGRNELAGHNGRAMSDGRVTRRNPYDNFSGYNGDRRVEAQDDDSAADNEYQPNTKARQSDRYTGNNNGNEQFVQDSEGPSDGFDANQAQNAVLRYDSGSRRRNGARLDDNGDLLFESSDSKQEQLNKVKKNERNDDIMEPNGQSRLEKKCYSLQRENRQYEDNQNYENRQDYSNRDRRGASTVSVDDSVTMESKEKKDFHEVANEDDQAAIKRHVKNLSGNELEELLNSLSEDKKALLQKIIDNNPSNTADNLSKREITKKAGAVEDNVLDSSKISRSPLDLNTESSMSQTEISKTTGIQGEKGDITSTKNMDSSISNSVYKDWTDSNDETAHNKQESNMNSVAPTAESATIKNENKREINLNDFKNEFSDNDLKSPESEDASNDQSYAFSQDEDLSQLMDDEANLHYDNHNAQKRGALQANDSDLSGSIKSLQESFPNSNPYDDSGSYSESDMAPLIRVKRTEHAVKKRAAAVLPQSNVAYVPYRAENEDEDNDEGNEFYDDGFFDRTANFAKSNVNKLSNSRRKLFKTNGQAPTNIPKRSNPIQNIDSSIGSDTDSVLSGVEGVDENLMFNGGARKKREVDKGSELELADDLIKNDLLTCPQQSTPSNDDKRSGPFANRDNYDGNAAFGSLSRSYDGELGRYKRIRRLKQTVTSTELSNLSTITGVE